MLGVSVPTCPESLIAKRLLYDDAIMRMYGNRMSAKERLLDLPGFDKDK